MYVLDIKYEVVRFMTKLIIAMMGFSLAAAVVFAEQKKKNDYPESTIKNFMDSCMETSKELKDYCECTLYKLQEKYTYEEFLKIDNLVQKGETPKEFNDYMNAITEECLK
jgi:hypothetical protein